MKRKILLKAPLLSMAGYQKHSLFVLRALKKYEHLFEIYIINIPWGRCGWVWKDDEERRFIDERIKETMLYLQQGGQFDASIQVTIPGEWEKLAPYNIGVTAGTETTKISPQWMQKCQYMDKIIVASEHTSYAFENTTYLARDQHGNDLGPVKVTTPVEVVNYPVWDELNCHKCGKNGTEFKFDSTFNFLLIAQWSPRKNIENTIKWWVEEFHDNPDVGLIVKTNIANNSRIDREYTEQRMKNLLSHFPNKKCKVYLLHGDLDEQELVDLYTHDNVHCMLSLSMGEGTGLPLLESAINDLPIICPGWGGQLDFLYKDSENEDEPKKEMFLAVDFDISQIQPEAVWDGVLQADSCWCFPKEKDAKEKFQEMYTNYEHYSKMALELGEWVREKFEENKQYRKLVESFGFKNLDLEPKPEKIIEFD